jgi:hypothetical protein
MPGASTWKVADRVPRAVSIEATAPRASSFCSSDSAKRSSCASSLAAPSGVSACTRHSATLDMLAREHPG